MIHADDARIGEKDGMQINKSEVLSLVIYVQLWTQRFVFTLNMTVT